MILVCGYDNNIILSPPPYLREQYNNTRVGQRLFVWVTAVWYEYFQTLLSSFFLLCVLVYMRRIMATTRPPVSLSSIAQAAESPYLALPSRWVALILATAIELFPRFVSTIHAVNSRRQPIFRAEIPGGFLCNESDTGDWGCSRTIILIVPGRKYFV